MAQSISKEKLLPVRQALDVALHDLTFSNGLLVTDLPTPHTFTLDNSSSVELLEKAIAELDTLRDKDNCPDLTFDEKQKIKKRMLAFLERVLTTYNFYEAELKILPQMIYLLLTFFNSSLSNNNPEVQKNSGI